MPAPYMASTLSLHEVAELHRLMTEEIKEVSVFFTDPHGIITVWNRAAEDMKGYTAQDAIGQHLSLLYTDEDKARGWPAHNLEAAKKQGFFREEGWRKRKDGTLFWARVNLTALFDDSGTLVGYSKITLDLTHHKMLERCTAERDQIQQVLRAAHAGTWTWHPETDQVATSADLLALLGYGDEMSEMTLQQWLALIHPDHQAYVAEEFEKARAKRHGTPIAMEVQFRKQDGNFHWFSVRADWYRAKQDEPFTLNGVNVDISDTKVNEAGLCRAIDQLTEADARKDEFLAMLAHELRNPLAPIRAAAELLNLVQTDAARVQRTSQIIGRQVDHMTGLINDLLDVSRVTKGLITLVKEPLNAAHVVTEAVEQVSPLLETRHQHLELRLPPASANVMGDNKRLVQILANLLHNAAKYTQEDGHIAITTDFYNNMIRINVVDDGIGMEPDLIAHAFDLFRQAKATPDRSSGGLGLGLSIVKKLVELHGGTVTCTSPGLGQGSTFTLSLPLWSPESRPSILAREGGAFSSSARDMLRIMVVDDNQDAADMLGMLLESLEYQVIVEYGALKALERSRIDHPDVYILDIGLPEMDGVELARRLKSDPETARAVLIAVTGYGQTYDRDHALAAGFNFYFVKPVETSKLVTLLSRIKH